MASKKDNNADQGRTQAQAAGDSQAQTTSGEDTQHAETPEQALRGAGGDERQFFEGTIAKIDRDGNDVMSDHLAPGETLRRATTDAYATDKRADRSEADAERREDSNK